MRKLVIALIVLAGLFVAVDRILVAAAENVVAGRVQLAADLEEEPAVQVSGFPFLTQAVRGVYRRVEIRMPGLTAEGQRLSDLTVRLQGVHAPLGQMLGSESAITVRADSATASVVVPYALVEAQVPDGMEVRRAGDRLRISGRFSLLGREVTGNAVVAVRVREDRLVFRAQRVEAAGQTISGQAAERFNFSVDMGQLPFGLRVTGVDVVAGGMRVRATGTDLLLSGEEVTTRTQ